MKQFKKLDILQSEFFIIKKYLQKEINTIHKELVLNNYKYTNNLHQYLINFSNNYTKKECDYLYDMIISFNIAYNKKFIANMILQNSILSTLINK